MTQGYPDFLRVSQRIGAPLINDTGTLYPGGHTYDPVYLGTWPAVQLFVEETAGDDAVVNLTWATTSDLSVVIGFDTYILAASSSLAVARTVLAPWLSVLVSTVAGGSGTWTTQVVPTGNVDPNGGNQSDPIVLFQGSTTIAASGTDTVTALACRPGPAVLSAAYGGAGFFSELQAMDEGGAWATLVQTPTTAAAGPVSLPVMLPRATVRLKTTNSSSVAHGYTASLIGQ